MSSYFENPFSDYGGIVSGNRFIGRRESLEAIENRVIRPFESGNLAIIGDYRIGKSSLVYKATMERRIDLQAKNMLPIWINLATYDRAAIFFRSLVTSCYDEMDDLGLVTDTIKVAANRALEDELSWGEGYRRIQRYFEKVRQYGYRIIFILDEFDHARLLFKGDISGFQGLRELSYRPEWRVTFITTSRRSLREIELQTKAISTLDGIFHKHYLGMFNQEDLQQYFKCFSNVGINMTTDQQEDLNIICGGHPYLLEMIGYELVEALRENQGIDIDKAALRVRGSFLDHYDHMINILKEDGTLDKMLQILFGPVFDVKQTDAEELLRYSLILVSDQGEYVAFSKHFQDYLKMIERQSDLWSLWRETEITLRNFITNTMIKKYGDNWVEKLLKARPHLKNIFEQCQVAQKKEEKTFGSRASNSLLDFSYPKDLFAIIFAEWDVFKSIMGKDTKYWNPHSNLLAKIRTPLAHNRDAALYEHERDLAGGYCKELLKKITAVR
ncbi:Swt1 family HEPN domain-containing protein [Desulfobacca acetoxidans]|uniref:Swt1-like HEPN domain-containing protein n=1 Tax=Desulfobacca acetoxidans (strain ATCC 700848 / DSM 11109 / ASRB2) TaxID=880072 RepID=F2ND38_DESAR|nr:Swt1 family HEPN domain-containing protein [Desulfobacca acetoxidans]AEB09762.1 hypothetical protein Desac_1927 [Desulfobacca acetoxidans DSM 11109]